MQTTEMRDTVTAAESAAGGNATSDALLPAPRQKLMRRGELAQLMDAKLAEDVEGRDSPRAPDAWLERRLRTFERQMSAMEGRQDQVEKNARAAAIAAEEAIKTLQATVEDLKQRTDAAEAKAKAAANELRMALNEATLRIQTVESVAHAALAENRAPGPAEPNAAATAPDEPVPAETPALEPAPVVVPADAAVSDAPASYLTEVRKSVAAAAAAAAAASAEAAAGSTARGKLRSGLTRYLLGGIVMLMIFATGAGVAFSKGVSDGRTDALSHGGHRAVVRVARLGGATPLDRLAARAEAGDAAAELAVGRRYLDAGDPAGAFHWIALAAVRGQPVAQYRLGLLYRSGTGTKADAARAVQWFEASAVQGNRKAMHDLAIAYAQGQGTAKNPSEAARWFSRAASFGYVDSEFDLAVLYERGDGVPQSLLDAYKWYAVAGAQGDLESKLRIEALRTQLNTDDLAAARHAAQAFHALPYDVAANTP